MVSAEGPRVRLRLHHGGSFTQVPGEANWRYSMQDTAGSIFNVTLDATTTYADFVHICNTKVNCACSIKYQSPGEPLAPDSLVTVSDDDDLQELVNEYMDALQRPGTEQRTFRIHVFLTPALTFGIEPEEDGMDASLGCHDEQINYEDYCGDDYSSCDPSSDTAWQASQPGGSRAHPASASAAAAATGPPQLQQAGRGPLVGMGLHGDSFLAVHHANTEPTPGVWGTAGMAGAGDTAGAWADGLATPRAEHEGGARLMGQPDVGHPLFTADDFHVEDPYMEEQSPMPAGLARKERVFDGNTAAAAPGPGFTAGLHNDEAALPLSAKPLQLNGNASNGNHPALPEGVLGPGKAQNLRGTPLYSRPLSSRVRDAASGLPSHISAFGDGGSKGASLHLPSHISAFGDGTAQEGVDMATEDDAQPGEEPGMRAWDASRCITQEFPERTASMQHVSQASPEDNPGAGRGPMDKQGDHPASGSGAGCPPTPKVLEQAGAKVPRADVVQAVKIGEGAFGEVSCATVFPFGTVAIKWLKKDRFAKYSESFQREAEVLARLNHPHIIRMYGLVTESANSPPGSLAGSASAPVPGAGAGNGGTDGAQPQPPATANGPLVRSSSGVGGAGIIIAGIMMEYLKGGSLAQRFRALAQSGRRLSLRERCLIARQAALGMSYLHGQTPAVIHFDLKPDNLLLEGEGEAIIVKVADFGLSKHKIQSYVTCHDLRGTLPYMAPELVKCPNQVCEKCDVWSMGVVMWEMVTLEVPFQELTAQDILRGLMQGSLHLRMPATCEPEWQRLITSCMEPEPVKRPTFRQLTERLDDMFKRLPPASLQTVGSSGHASNGLTQQHQPQLVQPVPPPPQVLVQQPQQHVLVAAAQQQQQQQQQHVTAAAVLMQQLQRHQQMELEQQQQVAVAAVAPFAHLQAAQQAAAVAQQPVGFHGPLFTPLYAHPQQPSSSPHLPGFYGDTNGLFAADTAAVIGGYGADAKAAAMLDNLNLFGQLAGHGHGAPHGAALPAAAPLPNHHNPLAYGLTHCQVAAAHPQLMYQ